MSKRIRPFVSALFLFASIFGYAQTTVTPGSYAFSTGVHPTFSFIFEGTNTKYVESYWRDELKQISQKVSNKKEVTGEGSLLTQVSGDTVRILMTAEQSKGSPLLTAHVAILTTSGYIAPDSDPKVYEAATAFVQMHSTAIRRQLAQQELTAAEKDLDRLKNDLESLEREKERAEAGVIKSNQKAAEAVEEQQSTKAVMDEIGPKVIALRAQVNATMNEDNAKLLKGMEKDEAKAIANNKRAQDKERSMAQKATDLAVDIKQNEEAQVRKRTEIEQQQTLVKALQEKLNGIK